MKGKRLSRTWCSWHFTGSDLFQLVAKDQHSLVSGIAHYYVSTQMALYITCCEMYFWILNTVLERWGICGFFRSFILRLTNGWCALSLPTFTMFSCNEKVTWVSVSNNGYDSAWITSFDHRNYHVPRCCAAHQPSGLPHLHFHCEHMSNIDVKFPFFN